MTQIGQRYISLIILCGADAIRLRCQNNKSHTYIYIFVSSREIQLRNTTELVRVQVIYTPENKSETQEEY